MTLPEALIVNTAFPGYAVGTLVTDPGTIATLIAGAYADLLTPVNTTVSTAPGLSVYATLAVAGQPIGLQGGAFNYVPSALDYSGDGGTTWAPVASFSLTNGVWTGYGPTYSAGQAVTLAVRDHTQTGVQASETFTVVNSPLSVVVNSVNVANVSTLPPGSAATFGATIDGSGHLNFSLGLPQGAPGTGSGSGFSLDAYGGVTGGADCTAALTAALAAASAVGQEVTIPGGDWWFRSGVALAGGPVAIRGQGKGITRLHFTHAGTAISISPSSILSKVVFRDLSMWAENASGPTACAIKVTMPSTTSFGYVTTTIENVEFASYPNSANGTTPFPQTWTRGIVLNNCWSTLIRDCTWSWPGSAAGASTAAMVEINASNDTRITGAVAYYGNALVVQTGYCNGLYLNNPVVVGCDYVFTQTPITGWTGYTSGKTSLLGMWCTGGEWNTSLGHLKMASVIDGFVVGTDITRDTGPGTAQVFFDFTDVSRFHIGACDWTGGTGGADIAIRYQSTFNSSGCSLLGGRFENMATVLHIVGNNGTVGGNFSEFSVGNVPLATAVQDESLASNGNHITFRTPATSSSPASVASPKDFLFSGLDNSTLLRVKSIQGGANCLYVTPVSTGNPPILDFTGSDGVVAGTIQTKGGSLFLSAAGDGSSGALLALNNLAGSTAWPVFQNATTGNLVLLQTSAGGLGIAPVGALFLGGTALYSASIAGYVSNPGSGNANQIWNNGGVASVALPSGFLPEPSFKSITLAGVQITSLGPLVSAQFGTTTGTVADGGVLAAETAARIAAVSAVSATASAAVPGAAVGAASGVAPLDGTSKVPLANIPSISGQAWVDRAGTSSVFSHGPVPTPPALQSGLTLADRHKIAGVFNFAEVFAQQTTYDAWPALQSYLLYAQLMYLAQKSTALDNVAERDFVDVVLPAGDFMVAQPLIVPENVRLGGPGRILRAPYTGNQSNNGTTSVTGPFATSQYLPAVVVVPRGHLSDLNYYCTTDGVFAHRGSGVCLGKNWQAVVGQPVTIASAGAGYSVGDIWVAVNPSLSPYSPFVVNVTAVNGSGAITAGTIRLGGAYALPPSATMYNGATSLQAAQWTTANGFTVFDPSNPGALLMSKAFKSDFATPSVGVGATIIPPWTPDYVTNAGQYSGGAALAAGTQVGRIQVTGAVPGQYDATYGPTFGVMITGLEFEIDSIQVLGGQAGLWVRGGQDIRIGRYNAVESTIGFWCSQAGSVECANVVLDTCGGICVIDQAHGIRMHGRAFFEEGNINSGNAPLVSSQGYAIKIGGTSNTSFPVSCCDLKFTVINMGGLPASTIAAYSLTGVSPRTQPAIASLAYLYSSVIDLTVSNTSQYAGAASPLPTSGIYQIGQNVDPGNDLRGSIDTVPTIDTTPAPAQVVTLTTGHGFPGCAIRVWDGLHQCWVGPFNVVEMFGAVAPTNGTSGTGAGLATPGSTYVDTAGGAGRRYVNTGTQSSPVWS